MVNGDLTTGSPSTWAWRYLRGIAAGLMLARSALNAGRRGRPYEARRTLQRDSRPECERRGGHGLHAARATRGGAHARAPSAERAARRPDGRRKLRTPRRSSQEHRSRRGVRVVRADAHPRRDPRRAPRSGLAIPEGTKARDAGQRRGVEGPRILTSRSKTSPTARRSRSPMTGRRPKTSSARSWRESVSSWR